MLTWMGQPLPSVHAGPTLNAENGQPAAEDVRYDEQKHGRLTGTSSADGMVTDTMVQGFEDYCGDTLGSRSDILLMVSASESSLWTPSLESYEFGLVVPNRSARKHRYDIERYHLPTVCHWLRVSLERCEDVLRRRQRYHVIYPHCRYTRLDYFRYLPCPYPPGFTAPG